MIESKYEISKINKGIPFFGRVKLMIQITKNENLEIIEKYNGKGFYSQGYEEIIPNEGYDNWKRGIIKGIEYAYSKLKLNKGIRVSIIEASGLTTDTNPTILGFVASRAILSKLENSESALEKEQLEEYMFSSSNFELQSIPNFNNN